LNVVVDGHTLNPGDLNWDALKDLGECRIYDRTAPHELLERISQAQIVLTNKVPLDRAIIEKSPELKYIGVLATGFNIVDVQAAKERGIPVCNVPGYGTASVAQAVFALLLELTNAAGGHSVSVKEGQWTRSSDFCYTLSPQIELAGLTLGIVGYGRIGQAVAAIARGFGMKVIAFNRSAVKDGAQQVSLDELFQHSDVISLHCPLTPETKELVNAGRIEKMKRSAFLINTSRGPLIDEKALSEALNSGRIRGAGLDVLSMEPPPADYPLLKAKNCIITPHIAWATTAARQRLMDVAVQNVRSFLSGQPRNVVNA
jgi:glycerate dehydrogenase